MKLSLKTGLIMSLVVIFALTAGIFAAAVCTLDGMDRDTDEIISRMAEETAGTDGIEALQAEKDNGRSAGMMVMIGLLAAAGVITILTIIVLSRRKDREHKTLHPASTAKAAGAPAQKISTGLPGASGKTAPDSAAIQKRCTELTGLVRSCASRLGLAGDQLAQAARQSGESSLRITDDCLLIKKEIEEQSLVSQEISLAVDGLDTIISRVSGAAAEQSQETGKAASEVAAMSQVLSQAAESAAAAAAEAGQATELLLDLIDKNQLEMAEIEKIKESTAVAARKIEGLGGRSREISRIATVIDDIASQTSLLALNAAIQAARTGEQESGFAQLSDEVGRLSERTSIASRQITDLINSLQKDIREAAELMTGSTPSVPEEYPAISRSGQTLERIQSITSRLNKKMEQLASKTRQASTAAGDAAGLVGNTVRISERIEQATLALSGPVLKINNSIKSAADTAGQNKAAIERISASAREMISRSQELTASSRDLKTAAGNMADSVAKYPTE